MCSVLTDADGATVDKDIQGSALQADAPEGHSMSFPTPSTNSHHQPRNGTSQCLGVRLFYNVMSFCPFNSRAFFMKSPPMWTRYYC